MLNDWQREWFQTVGVHSVFSVCRKRQRQGSGSKNLTGTLQQVFEWEAIFGSIIHESQRVKGADSGNGNRHQLKKIDFIIFLSS